MIKEVLINSSEISKSLDVKNQENFFVVDCSHLENRNEFDIKFTFTLPITAFRNHDYTWVTLEKNRIACEFSPKILKLQDGTYVQSNRTDGIWETDSKYSNVLYWRFNPSNSKPITKYTGNTNSKTIVQATSNLNLSQQPTLLFSKEYALEISRSKIPFSAVVCFTDHCDFDTLENLQAQRIFFKSNNIKVTKGFFLNHFSKRATNASFENDKEELELWRNEGHELCYHSLSQSIKSEDESNRDFINFVPPFSDIPVWIDHGYQPYNFSLFEKSRISKKEYEDILQQKNISILWNYIDSGTTTSKVINQLNPNHFTLSKFIKGNKNDSKIKQAQALIKNIVFHYLNDEDTIAKYKTTAQDFKKIVYQRKLGVIPSFLKSFAVLFKEISTVLLSWKMSRDKAFKLAKYTPLFFKHTINSVEFIVFQTVEMIDFSKSLSQENIENLINERGVFIAHTYFSDTIAYHSGKLLNENNQINETVIKNFQFLSNQIREEKIWNPTLSEFYDYLKQFEKCFFEIDAEGIIKISNSETLSYRKIQ